MMEAKKIFYRIFPKTAEPLRVAQQLKQI